MNNIDQIYSLRKKFTIIGLTGRTGAGASEISKNLTLAKFDDLKVEPPKDPVEMNKKAKESEADSQNNFKPYGNKERKYKITHNFLEKNWQQYNLIKYSKVLWLSVLKEDQALLLENLKEIADKDKLALILKKYPKLFGDLAYIGNIDHKLQEDEKLKRLGEIFFLENELNEIIDELNQCFYSILSRNKFLKDSGVNLRKSGSIFSADKNNTDHIYTTAEKINRLIKASKLLNKEVHVVIDSLRNSLEIMFFKERYSGFYMVSVNCDKRRENIRTKYSEIEKNPEQLENLVDEILLNDEKEYKGAGIREGKFYVQDVQNCIQKADIHLTNGPNHDDLILFRKYERDEIDGHFLNGLDKIEWFQKQGEEYLKTQLVKYLALIQQPGLITPSAQERCMQIAYNAKSNSGCISRQVGAVITDKNYSIKSVGWNDIPKGGTPCLLKDAKDLLNNEKPEDKYSFSPYERDPDKKYKFKPKFKEILNGINSKDFNGKNCSFCFKEIQNLVDKKDNQVHTRSLHAEENAMMQISKYGGQPLHKGILFTTASPCELCSKKSRQLEVTKIYYIDPYPGISEWHILKDTKEVPEVILYSGAVGRGYDKLFEPFMSYKDELALIHGIRPKEIMNQEIEKEILEKHK